MAPTRERIVAASAGLFGRQGYNGTGVKQIVAEANAPFGSIYHFFPGGKEELGAEVIRTSGRLYLALIDHFFAPGDDPVAATRAFFAAAADALVELDFADPCPIATVAMEVASTSEPLRLATAEAFSSWIERTAEHLAAAGLHAEAARTLAVALLAALEGGFMLGRALRDPAPVRQAGEHAVVAVREALAAAAGPAGGG
jgi:AcrR family transcriptional regulator